MLTRDTEPTIYQPPKHDFESVSYFWTCSRDERDLEATLDRYVRVIQGDPRQTDLVVVNNGLGERISNRIMSRLRDLELKATLVNFNVPTVESTVLSVAFRHGKGDVFVVLPPYPQSDPKDISRMLDAVTDGSDYVASWRSPRIDSQRDQLKSKLFNAATRWFAGIRLQDINSRLRVFRREVVEDLPLYGDLHIYLPVLAARQGFTIGEVPVRHLEERASSSAKGFSVFLRRGLDLLTLFFLMRFTQKPFRFFGGIGTGLLIVGGVINLVLAVQKIIFSQDLADRPMLVLATLLMVLGIQTFSLGLLGELIIFVNAGGVSDYRVERVYEASSESDDAELSKSRTTG